MTKMTFNQVKTTFSLQFGLDNVHTKSHSNIRKSNVEKQKASEYLLGYGNEDAAVEVIWQTIMKYIREILDELPPLKVKRQKNKSHWWTPKIRKSKGIKEIFRRNIQGERSWADYEEFKNQVI